MNNTPLTFKARGKTVTISLQRIGNPNPLINSLRYSKDGGKTWILWNEYGDRSYLKQIELNRGEEVQIVNTQTTFSKSQEDYYRFDISDQVTISGNIMSLVNMTNTITSPYLFFKLFEGCDKILVISKDLLPATTLKQSCYERMFENCYSLKNTMDILPASKLANKCYASMFKGCINLINTPILPAKDLVFKCYFAMFEGCINLKTISEIFAQKLATKACNYMFYGCNKIKAIKVHFKHWINEANENWLNTECQGTFIKPISLEEEYSNNRIPRTFKVVSLQREPLTFIVKEKESASSIALVQAGKPNLIELYYSLNYQTWTKYIPGRKLILKYGDVISFKNNTPFFSIDEENHYQFVMTGSFDAYGNVQSLINFRGLTCGVFTKLFDNCKSLKTAPKLNSLELVDRCYDRMFKKSGIKEAPVLLAREMKTKCYYGMFEGCEDLTKTPYLPAMKLANECYMLMFRDCINLTEISQLPAYKLAPECYRGMFADSGITTAPKLESLALAMGCYSFMFAGSKLITPPQLPAINLVANCYMGMFANCSSLTTSPALPAPILAENCYCAMFRQCTSLKSAPTLIAKEIELGSYENMFEGCTSLSSVTAYFKHWSKCKDTFRWLFNVAQSGTFYKSSDLLMDDITRNGSTIPETWNVLNFGQTVNEDGEVVSETSLYKSLTFTSIEENTEPSGFAKITLRQVGQPQSINIKYKVDDGDWYDYTLGTQVVLQKDHSISFYNDSETFSKDEENYYYFAINDGKVSCSGSINSLIGTDELKPYCYNQLFKDCHSLTNAPDLDSLVLAENCYNSMFYDCTGLSQIPSLPAQVLAPSCYKRMFYNCDGLTSVEVPNVIMEQDCCKEMFGSIDGLKEAKLPSKFLAQGCYDSIFTNCNQLDSVQVGFMYWNQNITNNWLGNVATSGVFKKPLVLKDNRGTSFIPQGWSLDLNQVEDIPLTFKFNGDTLVRLSKWGSPQELNNLYYRINGRDWLQYKVGGVLSGTKDDYIQFRNYDNFLNKDKDNYYHFEFKSNNTVDALGNVMSLVNFEKEIKHEYQFAYLFIGCKNLVKAPILPATKLSECCYYNMFNTTYIVEAPALPATELENKCYLGMFANCVALTAIPDLPANELKRCCYRNMFRNCTTLIGVQLLAPELFAGCYANMFNGCTNLNYIKVNFTQWKDISNNPTTCWLNGTSSLGTFQKPYNLEMIRGENNIPQNWEIVDVGEPPTPPIEPEPVDPEPTDPENPEIGG